MAQSEQNNGTSDDDVLKRLRARFQAGIEAESDIREAAREDLKFFGGDQWPEDIKNQRMNDQRPCLTINRLPQFVRQVTNEMRQSRPSIKVNPVDDVADVDTAEIIQGLIRHIEYDSNAEVAYDTACDYQVRCGFGYFRIVTEYCDPLSFKQKISIRAIRDPMAVVMDPDYTLPDGSDSNWGIIQDKMPKDSFKETYPHATLSSMADWNAVGKSTGGWCDGDSVRIVEYYEKIMQKKTILLLDDGSTVEKSEISEDSYKILKGEMPRPKGVELPNLVDERETLVPKVMWYKSNGIDILDKTEIFGSYIPIIPVLGDELFVDGKRQLESVIRHSKDPQRMYNFWETAKTEMIALAPKAPFIGVEGQFEGFESQWQQANTRVQPFMQFKKVVDGTGQAFPPPARQTYEPPIQAFINAEQQAAEDIKATTGIYDAELGNKSNEQSGLAILRRTQQSNTSNFHYGDNLKRSIRHGGRIIVQWIPFVYDGPQAVRVIGAEDNQQKIVKINQMFMKNGEQTIYSLDKGEYDVTVDTGPSFQTKRQEGSNAMMELTKAQPDTMKFALDLLVGNLDFPGAKTIADRIRKTMPPNLLEMDDDNKKPVPPEAQAQMQQMSQLLDQQSQIIAKYDELIKTKKIELESKERIELQKQRTDLVIAMMKEDAEHARLGFTMDVKQIEQRLAMLNENLPLVSNGGSAELNQPPGGQSPAQ